MKRISDIITPNFGEITVFRNSEDGFLYYKKSDGNINSLGVGQGDYFKIYEPIGAIRKVNNLTDMIIEVVSSGSDFLTIKAYKNPSVIGGGGGRGQRGSTGATGATGAAGGATGTFDTTTLICLSQLTPDIISINQNDYNPTGFQDCGYLRLRASGNREITGFQEPTSSSCYRLLFATNVGGAGAGGNIRFKQNNASSLANNRFDINGDKHIAVGEGIIFIYDQQNKRWTLGSYN